MSDLGDWVFTIPVPITAEELSDPKQKKKFCDRFNYPGDYSIERLYMKLSGKITRVIYIKALWLIQDSGKLGPVGLHLVSRKARWKASQIYGLEG